MNPMLQSAKETDGVLLKNYYDVVYNTEFPISNYYVDNFQEFPSYYIFTEATFKRGVMDIIAATEGYELLYKRSGDRKRPFSTYEAVYINEADKVMITVSEGAHAEREFYHVRVAYPAYDEEQIKALFVSLEAAKESPAKKGNITLIKSSKYGMETVDFKVKSEVKSLEHCYGEEFLPVHQQILSTLNTPKSKGIVLLHGEPGTGKSHYLRHLSTLLKKKVLWLPQTAADSLCNPEFITFLMENSNSVLIIEDGENVIKNRESAGRGGNAVSNLLNLTDGILSDCLHIQVVATFNTDIKNIDEALLRKGRLIVNYEFGKLSLSNTNRLLQYLGTDQVSEKEMTLADIYNINQTDLSNNKKSKKKIGFQS